MTDDKTQFDFIKADPSIKHQLVKAGLAMLIGFAAEALAKAAYDRYVIERRNNYKAIE